MWTHYLFVCTGESIPRSASQTAKKKNVCGKSPRGSAQQQLARSIRMLRISSPHSVWLTGSVSAIVLGVKGESLPSTASCSMIHPFLSGGRGKRRIAADGLTGTRSKKKKKITEREELNGRKGRAERAKAQSQGSGAGCVAECERSEAIPRERPACDQCKLPRAALKLDAPLGIRGDWDIRGN